MQYDLEVRTKKFSKEVIVLLKEVRPNLINRDIISQLIRSATSVGANYNEANDAGSKRDFRNKIYTCKKETNETKYWLRMLAKADDSIKEECRYLWSEVQGYAKMFSKTLGTLKNNKK